MSRSAVVPHAGSLLGILLALSVTATPVVAEPEGDRLREPVAALTVPLCPDEDQRFREDLQSVSYRIPTEAARQPLTGASEGAFVAIDERVLADGTRLTLWQTSSTGSGRFFSARVTRSGERAPVWEVDLLDGGTKFRSGGDAIWLVTAQPAGERECNACEDRYVITRYRWDEGRRALVEAERYRSKGKYYRWGTWVPSRQPPPRPVCD